MSIFKRQSPDIESAYEKYADILYRVAMAQLACDANAQDAVQDVFLKYLTAAPVFHDSEHERAWFLRVTVNRCHDIARHSKVREYLPIEDAHGVATEDAGGVSELMELISGMPSKYKDVIVLHCLEGFSMQETAEILKISLSAVKMRVTRARAILKEIRQEERDV